MNHWFFKRRGLALGVVTSGSSVGGVVWPIMIDHLIINVRHSPVPNSVRLFLQDFQVGFGWALRICGFIALVLTCVAAMVVRGRLPPRAGTEFFAFPLFRQPAYTIFW